ncbi:arsenite methyltransferase [Halostella sp. JP-L12]|uniref:arsenite methyltransferase n=1 Tax=Halostella TaxID=1843185 RepID=UPI000EF803AE|nr:MULTISPECIES: arsenite methyltransferase [Halostella]NHN48100.1 arsenite methyltransferase [Halostella sp. JP-L12]
MSEDARPAATDAEGLDAAEQRAAVRERYARIATESSACCGDGDGGTATADRTSDIGYSDDDREAVGSDAELSLGCGNPSGIAGLDEGETVLDLGSGAGFDCFLAAREVGPSGHVVGVDMTPEMVEKARENREESDATNVEFRLGEIEHLPVADESVDAVISNCVVNLSPDKSQVFREAYRVLRPGGRLAISDVVLTAEPPADLRTDLDSVAACVAGAASIPALEAMLTDAGFVAVSVEPKANGEAIVRDWDAERDPSDFVVAATIEAEKPAKRPDSDPDTDR